MIIKRLYLGSNSLNLYERAFSEGYEYAQKEFGFIQDVRRSGFGRTMKRNIGRFRNKIADKIDDSIENDFNKHGKVLFEYRQGERMINPNIERRLMRDVKSNNSRVVGVDLDGMKGNYTALNSAMRDKFGDPRKAAESLISNPFYSNAERIKNKISNSLSKGENVIFHPSGSGTDYLAHELGHIKNSSSKNPIRRLINKIGNNEGVRTDFNKFASFGLNDDGIGVGTSVSRFIKGKTILREEKNATNNALRDLKRNGATQNELTTAKKSLQQGIDTYKNLVPAYYKAPISNLIHTPGRREGIGYMRRKNMGY